MPAQYMYEIFISIAGADRHYRSPVFSHTIPIRVGEMVRWPNASTFRVIKIVHVVNSNALLFCQDWNPSMTERAVLDGLVESDGWRVTGEG